MEKSNMEKNDQMKKTYVYFCLFFIGSILPFLIVEFYFQDLLTIGFLMLAASLFLTFGLSLEHLKGRLVRWLDARAQNWVSLRGIQKKEDADAAASYYFHKNVW